VSSRDAFTGLVAELDQGIDEVTAALATGAVRYGIVAGAASRFSWRQAARANADISDRGFLKVVPGTGHFVWHEVPGAVCARALPAHQHVLRMVATWLFLSMEAVA
jgi:pimeloyl-ACP methyl ester carboxylesterase